MEMISIILDIVFLMVPKDSTDWLQLKAYLFVWFNVIFYLP
jgi:hypothetical protein